MDINSEVFPSSGNVFYGGIKLTYTQDKDGYVTIGHNNIDLLCDNPQFKLNFKRSILMVACVSCGASTKIQVAGDFYFG